MKVPTVNVIMSFNPQDLFQFLQSKTLDIFLDRAEGLQNKTTNFFTNGPASNFLSLTHSFGFGSGDSPRLELEFVDPQEVFEKRMTSFTPEGMMSSESSLVSFQIKKLEEKVRKAENLLYEKDQAIIDAQESERTATNSEKFGQRIEDLKSERDSVELALEQAKEELDAAVDDSLLDGGAIDEEDIAAEDNKVKKAIQEYNQNLLNKKVWIAYGIGDYLENWCPPMVFEQAIGAEYDVGGGQPRKLKLIYDGADTKPGGGPTNLLKNLGYRIICTGESDRILSTEGMQARKEYYDKLQSTEPIDLPYFKDRYGYSIHDVVTQVLTRYIQNATSKTNVLVLLPDLDKVLAKLSAKSYSGGVGERVWDYITGVDEVENIIKYLEGARRTFGELGMKLVESLGDGVQSTNNDIFSELEDEITNPADISAYLDKTHIHVVLSSNIENESFKEAMDKVFKQIKKYAQTAFGEGTNVEDFEYVEHVVNDYIVLSSLARKGLISTAEAPLLVVGTRSFVEDFLYGQVAFKNEKGGATSFNQIEGETVDTAAVPPHITAEINKRISPLDILKGLDSRHIKNMAFYQDPSLAFSPFGFPAVNDDEVNVKVDEGLANRFTMPIFTLGTRNANVLELKMDMNSQYLASLSQTTFSKDTYNSKIEGILTDDTAKKNVTDVLNGIDSLDFETLAQQINSGNGGPELEKFKKLVDPFRGRDGWGWSTDRDDDETFDALMEVFEEINDEFADQLSKAGSYKTGQDEFYKGMYKLFTGFMNDYPRMELQLQPGTDATATVSTLAAMRKFLRRSAITGSVKTLPLFQLSSSKRTINKNCFVYAREPRFQGVSFPDVNTTPPFYTGNYTLTGFRHTISSNNAHSEFTIARGEQ